MLLTVPNGLRRASWAARNVACWLGWLAVRADRLVLPVVFRGQLEHDLERWTGACR